MTPADATPLCPMHIENDDPEPSVRSLSPGTAADDPEHPRAPSWKAPPKRRANITNEARIVRGEHKVHLTIDLYDDGRPCAVWVVVHKEGAPFRSVLETMAADASAELQSGMPIQFIARRWCGVRFEPDGAVEGHEPLPGKKPITSCTSLVDLLGQMLLAEFPAGGSQ